MLADPSYVLVEEARRSILDWGRKSAHGSFAYFQSCFASGELGPCQVSAWSTLTTTFSWPFPGNLQKRTSRRWSRVWGSGTYWAETRRSHVVVDVLPDDLNRVTDPHLVRVTVDDVYQHACSRALGAVQVDDTRHVGACGC